MHQTLSFAGLRDCLNPGVENELKLGYIIEIIVHYHLAMIVGIRKY